MMENDVRRWGYRVRCSGGEDMPDLVPHREAGKRSKRSWFKPSSTRVRTSLSVSVMEGTLSRIYCSMVPFRIHGETIHGLEGNVRESMPMQGKILGWLRSRHTRASRINAWGAWAWWEPLEASYIRRLHLLNLIVVMTDISSGSF